MHYWVGITDRDWFETLRHLQPDEVNFWQPSQRAPRATDAGWPFLILLANVPDRLTDQPGREFLEWHDSEVYLG